MLLIIFGAGASYDSASGGPSGANRPPLAKHLVAPRYDTVAAEYPLSRPIIDRLREKMDGGGAPSLEAELARLASDANDRPERRQQLVVFRFYLQRLVAQSTKQWRDAHYGFTHYLRLVNRLYDVQDQTGPILFVTFNYDCLLEAALETFLPNHTFGSLFSYVSNPMYQLFKLHGSVTWSRLVRASDNSPWDTVAAAVNLAQSDWDIREGPIVPQPPPTNIAGKQGAYELLIPALAVPMADKTDFECPHDHLSSLKGQLSEVDRVIIIGWRAAERHAVELLDGLKPGFKLGLVSGNERDYQELLSNLGPVRNKAHAGFVDYGGFSSFIGGIDGYLGRMLSRI